MNPVLTPLLLGLLCAAAAAQADAAQVYRWTDADGKAHFSDRPPTGGGGTAVGPKGSNPPNATPLPLPSATAGSPEPSLPPAEHRIQSAPTPPSAPHESPTPNGDPLAGNAHPDQRAASAAGNGESSHAPQGGQINAGSGVAETAGETLLHAEGTGGEATEPTTDNQPPLPGEAQASAPSSLPPNADSGADQEPTTAPLAGLQNDPPPPTPDPHAMSLPSSADEPEHASGILDEATAPEGSSRPIFRSGFEPPTQLRLGFRNDDIVGADSSVAEPNDWVSHLEGHPEIGAFSIQYQGGNRSDRLAAIIKDPTASDNHVLHFWLHRARTPAGPSNFKGRIQANLYGNRNIEEVYFERRIFLHPDFTLLASFPEKIQWLTIEELWATAGWIDHPHPFRISLNLIKEVGGDEPFRFAVHGQKKTRDGWWAGRLWEATNTEFRVPVNTWIKLITYYKQGAADEGRYCLTAELPGGEREVVFNLLVPTYDPASPQPISLTHWNPLKLYTSAAIVDHVRHYGGTLQMYMDDIAIWRSVPSSKPDFPCP